jgi:1-deoxy-D-xylulose-5-phosphate synthase
VLFAIDRAGIVGPDGPTHAGVFDISFLRCLPDLVIMTPSDEAECRRMLTTGFRHSGPAAVRYPRGTGPGAVVGTDLQTLPIGKGEIRRRGENVALLAFGPLLAPALAAADCLEATVANMRFVKPIDGDLIEELAKSHRALVTLEDNVIQGGAGSAVGEYLSARGITIPILHLGLPDTFLEQGGREELLAECGLDTDGILAAVRAFLATEVANRPAVA